MFIKVLPAQLVVVRLQLEMLQPSTHALVKRLLFSGGRAGGALGSYTRTEEEISLVLDQARRRARRPRHRAASAAQPVESGADPL